MPTRTGKPRKLTVVEVLEPEAWPCEICDKRDVIAVIVDRRDEETHGYCERCIGPAIKGHLRY